jgi:hypothetical protein
MTKLNRRTNQGRLYAPGQDAFAGLMRSRAEREARVGAFVQARTLTRPTDSEPGPTPSPDAVNHAKLAPRRQEDDGS